MIRPAVPVALLGAALLFPTAPARAQETAFTLVNRTGEPIRSVYATDRKSVV